MSKITIYPLFVSEQFPGDHPRHGEPTDFEGAIVGGIKIHTIRGNYPFWEKRIRKVEAGKAVLSLRQWVGKPYGKGSTVREICQLGKEHGVGISKVNLWNEADKPYVAIVPGPQIPMATVADNDGLSLQDFQAWLFKKYDHAIDRAMIHFTPFRYEGTIVATAT